MKQGMSTRAMVWAYVVIEALVLIPIVIYVACHK